MDSEILNDLFIRDLKKSDISVVIKTRVLNG